MRCRSTGRLSAMIDSARTPAHPRGRTAPGKLVSRGLPSLVSALLVFGPVTPVPTVTVVAAQESAEAQLTGGAARELSRYLSYPFLDRAYRLLRAGESDRARSHVQR